MLNLPFTMRQLEVFASLCEAGSFGRSAESLGVSQASVSNQMKMLEEQLGLKLFVRRPGKRPSLTSEGMAFLKDFHAFEESAKLLAAHRRDRPGISGPARFRLLVGQGLWDNFIRPKLDCFVINNPQIKLEFDARPPDDNLPRALVDGTYDFALLHIRAGTPMEPYMRTLALLRGGVYGHRRFAEGRRRPLRPADIAQLPFLLPPSGSTQEREALKALRKHGIFPSHIVNHSEYYDVIAAMLDRGVAVANFTEALVPPTARQRVVLLYALNDWKLVWFDRKSTGDSRQDIVRRFIFDSVLGDRNYPALKTYDEKPADANAARSGPGHAADTHPCHGAEASASAK